MKARALTLLGLALLVAASALIGLQPTLAGQFLRTLVGYTPTPSFVEVMAYIGYWLVTLGAVRWWTEWLAAKRAVAAAE